MIKAIKSINDINPGDVFYTSTGEKLIAKNVGMLSYPALLTECIPVEAVTAEGIGVIDRFFVIASAGLTKTTNFL